MGKYTEIETLVYSVFDTVGWKSENIPTYPSNFVVSAGIETYIRLNILASSGNMSRFPGSVSGLLIIDVFTPAGKGTNAQFEISDTIDKYLAGKSIIGTGSIQFNASTLKDLGVDSVNKSLNRLQYSISFSYYGV